MRPPTEYDGGARVPSEAEEGDPRVRPMMICARLAGRAIIRVVGRCEDAQENSQLGAYLPNLTLCKNKRSSLNNKH